MSSWLGWAGALAAAILVGLAATLTVAAFVAVPAMFLPVGVIVALAVWVGGNRLLGRGRAERSRRLTVVTGGVVIAAIFASALVPLGDPVVAPPQPPGAGVWELPDGGHLAYGVVRPAQESPSATPVLVLHGGPGVPDTTGLLTTFHSLADAGHDVWAYDQRGTGRSTRLADPRGYTLALAVADLEQARRKIGAEQMILIGHSYGAALAAAYIADHPDRVERIILISPGDLRKGGTGGQPQVRLDADQRWNLYRLLLTPRALLAYALVQVNPLAAHAFADDRELDARQDRVYAATLPGLHCPGRTGPPLHGLGFYSNAIPQSWRQPLEPDITTKLSHAQVPALIIKGQCDYLSWPSDYLAAFPNNRLVYVEGAGHDVQLDSPTRLLSAASAFLADRPVPGVLQDPHQPPPGYQP